MDGIQHAVVLETVSGDVAPPTPNIVENLLMSRIFTGIKVQLDLLFLTPIKEQNKKQLSLR